MDPPRLTLAMFVEDTVLPVPPAFAQMAPLTARASVTVAAQLTTVMFAEAMAHRASSAMAAQSIAQGSVTALPQLTRAMCATAMEAAASLASVMTEPLIALENVMGHPPWIHATSVAAVAQRARLATAAVASWDATEFATVGLSTMIVVCAEGTVLRAARR